MNKFIITVSLCIIMIANIAITSCTQKLDETEQRLNSKIDSLQAVVSTNEKRLKIVESDIIDVDTKIDSNIMVTDNLKGRVDSIEKDVVAHQKKLESIEKEVAQNKELIKKISTKSAKTYSEVQKLKKLQSRVDSLEKKQRESTSTHSSTRSYENTSPNTSTLPADTTATKKPAKDPVTETEKTEVKKKRKKFL